MVEEVAEVCRDYCTKTWNKVLNSVGVPADSKLRKAERVYFPEHIKEIPTLPQLLCPYLLLSRFLVLKILPLTLGPLLE